MVGKKEAIKATESSGNVFADLGLDNPEELKTKAKIAAAVNSIIKHRHLKQSEASRILGITQPQVSDLNRGKLNHFSVERLFEFLNSLDRDIEIVIKKKRSNVQRNARIEVRAG